MNGIQRQISRDRPAPFRLADFFLSDCIISGHFFKRTLTPTERITSVKVFEDIPQLHGLIVSVFIGKMDPDAAGIIFNIFLRPVVVIRHGARDGNGDDAAGIFRIDVRIARDGQIAGQDRIRRAVNAVVGNGCTDSCRAAHTDTARQIDISRHIGRRQSQRGRRDIRIFNPRLRRVVDSIQPDGRIESDGLRRAARRRDAQIQRIRLGFDVSFPFRRRHRRSAVDIGFRRILLFHPQKRAAESLLGRFRRIQSVNIEKSRLFPEHRRR